MPVSVTHLFIIGLLLGLPLSTSADTDALEAGKQYFRQGDFRRAISLLEQAVARQPGSSQACLWLGRAYGRQAEQANWLSAIGLARKTLRSFEQAVKLDADNIAAKRDLREFYRTAPAFLGGSEDKARILDEELRRIELHQPAESGTDAIAPVHQIQRDPEQSEQKPADDQKRRQ